MIFNLADVDLLRDEDGKSYLVEVNGNSGSKIIEITGHNYFADLVKFAEPKAKKSDKKQEDSSKASASDNTGIMGRIKAAIFGQSTKTQSRLSAADVARLKDYERLKAKYAELIKEF